MGVQDKLRAEILDVRLSERIAYEQLMALPLLDSVVRETLRLFPPVPMLPRT
jgi:cytochrome P450